MSGPAVMFGNIPRIFFLFDGEHSVHSDVSGSDTGADPQVTQGFRTVNPANAGGSFLQIRSGVAKTTGKWFIPFTMQGAYPPTYNWDLYVGLANSSVNPHAIGNYDGNFIGAHLSYSFGGYLEYFPSGALTACFGTSGETDRLNTRTPQVGDINILYFDCDAQTFGIIDYAGTDHPNLQAALTFPSGPLYLFVYMHDLSGLIGTEPSQVHLLTAAELAGWGRSAPSGYRCATG